MRPSSWLTSLAVLSFSGLVVAACGSGSGSGGAGQNETDGGFDGATDGGAIEEGLSDTSASCGDVAACYSVVVTIAAGSPLSCGSGSMTTVADYTGIPSGGGSFTTAGASGAGCTGLLMGCDMTLSCPNGEAWTFHFNSQGFDATVSLPMAGGACMATAVAMKLTSCPASTGTSDAGAADGLTTQDASIDAVADASPDTTADASTPEATIADAPTDVTGSIDHSAPVADQEAPDSPTTNGEASVESSAPEAAAAEASVEASVDASADASADAGSPDGTGVASGDDGSADAAAEGAPSGDDAGGVDTGATAVDGVDGGDDAADAGGVEAASE
jgi:hypothetical protein